MAFAPVYLINRFFFRLSAFFRHWYIDGSRVFEKKILAFRKHPVLLAIVAIPFALAYAVWLAAPFYTLFMAYYTFIR